MAILVISQLLFWFYVIELSLPQTRNGLEVGRSINYIVILSHIDIVILIILACSLVLVAIIAMVVNLCFSCKAVDPSMRLSRL